MMIRNTETMARYNLRLRQIKTSRGFTLIELLLAFFILSLMLGITFGVISGVNRSKAVLEDTRAVHLSLDSLVLRLFRELQLADPGTTIMPPENELNKPYPGGTSLLGEPQQLIGEVRADSLTFMAKGGGQFIDDGSSNTGLVQIRYRLEPNPDKARDPEAEYYLVRDEAPLIRPYEDAYKKRITFPVAKNVDGLKFRYLSHNGQWSDEWGKGDLKGLPRIVEFTLKIKSPSGNIESFTSAVPLKSSLQQDQFLSN